METVEYAQGRFADVYGDPAQRTVLMWHGAQADARGSMRPLADHLAGYGVGVVVADWNSHADDRGRADLLASLHFAREASASPDDIVLVGWSLGGAAAAGVNIHAGLLDVRVAHTVCLAGAFMVVEPVSARPLPRDLADYRERAPFTLLHGVDDDVIPVAASGEFAATLRRYGWPVEVVELPTDHAAIAGAEYDPTADRYSAAHDPAALSIAADVAGRIAAMATRSNA
ncbi:alpha/beta hydrolase [Mycolicibacterium tusciae]|uniref:alpha/beta hydrolase n=1 Tax=Mycolicibacterium tusciae TaxID=75922 RepID=UPI00024A4B4B|nr:alpha/beta fold hydrolase [Mycolicibacterium tusciae]